ncbi:type 2 periplasmic-binding domain-containing protein [Ructibacterium gallinarum]|uniref:Extracellular solute-binding protein n=1 Tax=Ructibacterium gallinarum TaxID=2779355 RepID=A0A9D5RBS0_9FIRM|nr:extracellular solute-binding protein [Ructibacterium gallinarum]MBE5040303.1 extracellular solute-binding protein [Ructibacterium gallinarum]
MKKIIALMLATVTVVSFTACGQKQAVNDTELKEVTTTGEYPMDTDVELRWWMQLPSQVTAYGTSLNDTPFAQYLYEATGVKVKFEHPVSGEEEAAMNILLSSDDMPDIVEWNWNKYSGGPDKAIEDGVILELDSYMDQVLPNLKKVYDEHPDWAKQAQSADGHYYMFPMINEDEELSSYIAMLVRKDLLDKAGLEAPDTLEEWENVLYTFRDMGVETPLNLRLSNYWLEDVTPFGNFFDFIGTFYHDENGTIHFGPYEEDKFTPWVQLMKKWYNDGILDKEFADGDMKRINAMVTNGENGALFASIGGELGGFLSAIPEGSGIEYQAVNVPTKTKGEIGNWWNKGFDVSIDNAATITASSKNKEIAARLLDFGYTQEGYMLYNFGKEGESYEIKNGVPTYLPSIVDPDQNGNLTIAQGMSKCSRANYWGPFVRSVEYIHQFYPSEVQKDALKKTASNTLNYKYPNISLSAEDSKTYNDIMTPIDTYREETITKIISGKMDFSEMENYYAELKRLGIEDAIALKQKAYDEYINAQK